MIQCKITKEGAVIPKKAGNDEVGYDLTAISLDKVMNGNTYMFDTGIQVMPPDGYYLEIIPRSSIVKTGYMLANSIGIIDPTYRGNLKIVLTKVSDTAQDLVLPFTKCQLVVRKMESFDIVDIGDSEWKETTRGDGGFGSTDSVPPTPYTSPNLTGLEAGRDTISPNALNLV